MALSIRNKATEDAVRRLAARTGTGLTEAIDDAVNRRLTELDRERHDPSPEAQAAREARLERVLAEFRKNSHPETWLTDDDLYDDMGLPK
ncbi:MAG: type II toxin-antitoxin system VapB family antitoxin [Austwickia sp.]|jgi:antitoxin VapB|nr:MAG: type II toxin-antitoxin system VapB family antitoxin [Austwickia sp.]